jgi:DNA-binding transcriptional MerR regulator
MTTHELARYTIAEAAASTGTTVDTLRYYERVGVLPPVARDVGGQRTYTDEDLGRIMFVRRLRATGMPMRTLVEYAELARRGDETVTQRRRLLRAHRDAVAAAIEELTTALGVLDRKLAHYEAAERGVDLGCGDDPLRHVPRLG